MKNNSKYGKINTGAWILSYPHESGGRCVGPFPTKQAALEHPIESDVCSVSPLFSPQEDLEGDE